MSTIEITAAFQPNLSDMPDPLEEVLEYRADGQVVYGPRGTRTHRRYVRLYPRRVNQAEVVGRQALRDLATPEVVELAALLVLEGRAEWAFDGSTNDVVALLWRDQANALVLVYLTGIQDFELAGDFEAML